MTNNNYFIEQINIELLKSILIEQENSHTYYEKIIDKFKNGKFEAKIYFNNNDFLDTVFVFTILEGEKVWEHDDKFRKGYDVWRIGNDYCLDHLNSYLGITFFTTIRTLSKENIIQMIKSN